MEQNNNEIDVRAWLVRIWKNWYWFVISGVLCLGMGAYYYMSHTPHYKVDARIMLRNGDSDNSPQLEMLQMMGFGGTKVVDDEIAILTSRDLITQVVRELDLQTEYRVKKGLRWQGQYPTHDVTIEYPAHFLDTTKRSVNIQVKVRKSDYVVKVKYGRFHRSRHVVTEWGAPIQTVAGSMRVLAKEGIEQGKQYRIRTYALLSLVDAYQKNCVIAPIKKESNVISLSNVTDMPAKAIDFFQKQIELYNLDAVVDKNLLASNTAAFIEDRLRLIETELSDAEQGLERYKTDNHITDLSAEAKIYLTESAEYRNRMAEVETQMNLVQYIGEFIHDESKNNMLIPANLGITDESLANLINEYNALQLQRMRVLRTATNDNPVMTQMNTQLALMRGNIHSSIVSVKESLRITRSDLEHMYGRVESQREGLPNQERLYIEVARKKALKERLYLFLYEKREENALTLASSVMPAKVIAKPQCNPSVEKPKLKILALLCLIMGMGAPIALMVLYDLFNDKVSDDSQDLQRKLTIPFLGTLVQNHHGGFIAVSKTENSASAELFRTLRTNLRFFLPVDSKNPVVLVTSCVNSEGKSYVAGNLAISLSLIDKKVALVGMDIRNPMLAHYFNLSTKGCLTSYLADSSYQLEDVIVPSGLSNLDILPAGVVPPNPSELLLSERLDELFARLRKRYDYIIVDTAPIALVSDTYQLDRIADMTIFVSRAHCTSYQMLDFINQTNQQHRLKNMVSVLNGAAADKIGYGYGYGYGVKTK